MSQMCQTTETKEAPGRHKHIKPLMQHLYIYNALWTLLDIRIASYVELLTVV